MENGTHDSGDPVGNQTQVTVTQKMNNTQILSQLSALSQQLEKIESTTCKKISDLKKKIKNEKVKKVTSDNLAKLPTTVKKTASTSIDTNHASSLTTLTQNLPQLNNLRQDLLIQAQVEKRFKELAEIEKSGTKQILLRGGSVEI